MKQCVWKEEFSCARWAPDMFWVSKSTWVSWSFLYLLTVNRTPWIPKTEICTQSTKSYKTCSAFLRFMVLTSFFDLLTSQAINICFLTSQKEVKKQYVYSSGGQEVKMELRIQNITYFREVKNIIVSKFQKIWNKGKVTNNITTAQKK